VGVRRHFRRALITALIAAACVGLAGCGGATHVTLPGVTDTPALAAPGGRVDGLDVTSTQLRQATAAVSQETTGLQRRALAYLALGAGVTSRDAAARAIDARFAALARHYAQIAPLVEATPALHSLSLGDGAAGSEARTDSDARPLDAVAAVLGAGDSLPAGSILVTVVDRLQSQAARLAIATTSLTLTPTDVREALVNGLEDLAGVGASESQTASMDAIDLSGPRATLGGLITMIRPLTGTSPRARMLTSFAPGLRSLRTLLPAPERDAASTRLIASELTWRATDLAAKARRADGEPGPAAAAAAQVESDLFQARLGLTGGDRSAAAAAAESAQATVHRALIPSLVPSASRTISRALGQALSAARSGDETALSRAVGTAVSALMIGAYATTLQAVDSGQLTRARAWAAVRDLGPGASGSSGDDALRAADALAAGSLRPAVARLIVRRDELSTFQARDIALVAAAGLASDVGDDGAQADNSASASGYWAVLEPILSERLGARSAAAGDRSFIGLDASSRLGVTAASMTAAGLLGAFTAAPATASEQEQRIPELVNAMRFTVARLCQPNGASASSPTLPGTAAGPPVIIRLINDLRPSLAPGQAALLTRSQRALEALPGSAGMSGEDLPGASSAGPSATVAGDCETAVMGISTVFSAAWRQNSDNADFVTIDHLLSQVQSEARSGAWSQAEGAAQRAYAVFDLTPELRLRAIDPGLALEIEGLFWNGSDALFDELAEHDPATKLAAQRGRLTAAVLRAQVELQSSHSQSAVVVNGAIVVFREGLEALLIVAALGAGFVSTRPLWRRPVVAGAAGAIPLTLITWALASALLGAFDRYSLSLQAVLDLLALAMLAVMLTWFFQKFCWTRFTAREQARQRRWLGHPALRGIIGPAAGLYALGFFLVYREGFETVLFLQALRVEGGTGAVLEGVLLGVAFTAAIGVLMLLLRRRLPYRGVVVVTAALIGILTVAIAGETARALQAAGWLSITPLNVALPGWTGLWLGVYPSLQTMVAQIATVLAIGLVAVGSSRRRTRRLTRQLAQATALREARLAQRRAARAQPIARQPEEDPVTAVGASSQPSSAR
jgi:high-affinity iron transporter